MDVQSLKIDRGTQKTRNSGGGSRRRGSNPWVGRLLIVGVIAVLGFVFQGPLLGLVRGLTAPRVTIFEVVEPERAGVAAISGTAANGYIVAARRAALSADTPGRIVEMNVAEGSRVEKGFIVAKLFQDEFRAAWMRAEAELATADANVLVATAAQTTAEVTVTQRQKNLEASGADRQESIAQYELAVVRFERSVELVESGVSSQDELDQARSDLDAAQARVEAMEARVSAAGVAVQDAEARVEQAKADLVAAEARVGERRAARDLAKATLDKTEIRAPFDGIVVLKDAEVGEVVSPNSQGGSNARGSICTMVDRESLEVQAEVPEKSLTAVRVGGRVLVFPDADPSRRYEGRVDRIWPTASRQKATVEVRAKLEELDDFLIPDMGVRIVFDPEETNPETPIGDEDPDAYLIPTRCVVDGEEGPVVYVVARGVVEVRAISVLKRKAREVAVTDGLRPGDRLVIDPPADLKAGDSVTVESDD